MRFVTSGAIPLLLGQGAECIGESNLAILKSSLITATEILTDGQGVDVRHMRKTLEEWPAYKQKPKVLYTVPVSQLHTAQHE
jgi:hypothetical protein